MILVWNSVKSFQRHLEEMNVFRQAHSNSPVAELKMIKALPMPFDIRLPRETGIIKSFYNSRGTLVLVPIWKVTVARGSQN
ncbi:MAG: hypothetical protein A2Y58_01335 [Chloroflexi bacterium RBG_13_51_52]|nr:MAG: hypothetical protein A2Y58_01335 [Chloroflexi bacterium RBG_13_51_52]